MSQRYPQATSQLRRPSVSSVATGKRETEAAQKFSRQKMLYLSMRAQPTTKPRDGQVWLPRRVRLIATSRERHDLRRPPLLHPTADVGSGWAITLCSHLAAKLSLLAAPGKTRHPSLGSGGRQAAPEDQSDYRNGVNRSESQKHRLRARLQLTTRVVMSRGNGFACSHLFLQADRGGDSDWEFVGTRSQQLENVRGFHLRQATRRRAQS